MIVIREVSKYQATFTYGLMDGAEAITPSLMCGQVKTGTFEEVLNFAKLTDDHHYNKEMIYVSYQSF